MADHYYDQQLNIDSVIVSGFAVTPSNTTLTQITRAIYVGKGGNLSIQTAGFYNEGANTYSSNTVITLVNVPTGSFLPIRAVKIYATSTANNIVGLY